MSVRWPNGWLYWFRGRHARADTRSVWALQVISGRWANGSRSRGVQKLCHRLRDEVSEPEGRRIERV